MEAPAEKPRRRGKRAYLVLAVIAVVVAGAWLGHRWWTRGQQKTDDAQVEADIVPVTARVAGTLKTAKVSGGQEVHAGDVLFELDPEPLDIEVARAQGEVDAARAQERAALAQVAIVESTSHGGLTSARAAVTGASASARGATETIRAAEAAVARAKSDLGVAETEFGHTQELFNKGAVTRRDLDLATQALEGARASMQTATAQLDSARANRSQAAARVAEAEGRVAQSTPVDQQIEAAQAAAANATARVKTAMAALAKAKLDRAHATITAPISGVVSKRAVQVGQSIRVDRILVMIVPSETYIIANFKETQIAQMHPGDRVDIELDAFDSELSGVVDSISPATGARFSMLPPDNATGNFVKVVQRVPVKITWKTPPKLPLRPGLSAEVVVHTSSTN
jgi:membrane fusion protein (multidrug efflux system)